MKGVVVICMDIKELKDLVSQVAGELKKIGVPISDNIEKVVINNRAKKRLGCCKRRKNTLGKTFYTIEISKYALNCEEKNLRNIIAHELIHTCRGCFNHGKKWKKLAGAAELKANYHITRTVDYKDLGLEVPASANQEVHIIVCEGCGLKFERKRMCKLIKNIGNYRCGKCGSSLKYAGKSTTSCR